jgi:hypothetical protein
MSADDVIDTGKVAFCGRLAYEPDLPKPGMVRWSDDVFGIKDGRVITNAEAYIDDGSAACEPEPSNLRLELMEQAKQIARTLAPLLQQTEEIGRLRTTNDQLQREIAMMREFVSRLPEDDGSETASTGVQADIDRVCDHLFKGHTDDKQRAKLRTSVDRAERVRLGSDAAVGRALR